MAIRVLVDGEMLDGSLDAPETPSDEALPRKVFRSLSSAGTLTPARMWVVLAPPTVSFPATVGLVNQCSGLIPSFPSAPEPDPPPEDDVSEEKLDSSCWKVAGGSW